MLASPEAVPAPIDRPAASTRVEALTITVLSTSVAPRGVGEWGFAALVEADGHRILFDTGARPDTVLRNAQTLGLDLRTVTDVVLSHHHDDHVGGLLRLREAMAEAAPHALATVHVAEGIFEPRRYGARAREVNDMLALRPAVEATGGTFVVHAEPAAIAPGVWVTGPVPRVHPEHNFSGARRLRAPGGWVEDSVPESQSLVVDTARGLVLLSGCGHAGIINTITHARATIRAAPVHAALGGFHLHRASAPHLQWTAAQLEGLELEQLFGAHCTGRKAVARVRQRLGLGPHAAAIAPVGGRFVLGEGLRDDE